SVISGEDVELDLFGFGASARAVAPRGVTAAAAPTNVAVKNFRRSMIPPAVGCLWCIKPPAGGLLTDGRSDRGGVRRGVLSRISHRRGRGRRGGVRSRRASGSGRTRSA